jgi:hypothetical protein
MRRLLCRLDDLLDSLQVADLDPALDASAESHARTVSRVRTRLNASSRLLAVL